MVMTKTLYIVLCWLFCDSWNFHHLDQMNFCHIMLEVCKVIRLEDSCEQYLFYGSVSTYNLPSGLSVSAERDGGRQGGCGEQI